MMSHNLWALHCTHTVHCRLGVVRALERSAADSSVPWRLQKQESKFSTTRLQTERSLLASKLLPDPGIDVDDEGDGNLGSHAVRPDARTSK